MKFNLRKINLEKDENYFNQTTYEGFKITYCKEKDLDEKEIEIRYQEFLRTAGNQLDPRKTDYSLYIAEDEIGKYAGILWLQNRKPFGRYKDNIAWVCNIFINPEFRRNGLATLMLSKTEEWAIYNNLLIIGLHVATKNLPARKLYERFNFILVSKHENSCFYEKKIQKK